MSKERTSNCEHSLSSPSKVCPRSFSLHLSDFAFSSPKCRKRSLYSQAHHHLSALSSSTIYVTAFYVTLRWRRCRRTAFLEQQTKPRTSFSLSLGKGQEAKSSTWQTRTENRNKNEKRRRREPVKKEVYQLMNSLRSLERQWQAELYYFLWKRQWR